MMLIPALVVTPGCWLVQLEELCPLVVAQMMDTQILCLGVSWLCYTSFIAYAYYYDISSGKTVLYCDHKGAIGNSFKLAPPGITFFLDPDYYLLGLIHELVKLIPITVIGHWVKGHYKGRDRQW